MRAHLIGMLLLLAPALQAAEEPGAPAEANQTRPAEIAPPAEEKPAEGGAEDLRRHVRWQDWDRSTFEAAAALRRPVLLYLRAADCRLCAGWEAGALDDPRVVEIIRDCVVPVAVDVDRRPDIAARYGGTGVPTVTLLLPNGEPIYRVDDPTSLQRLIAYFDDPERLGGFIERGAEYMRANSMALARKAREVADVEAKVRAYTAGAVPLDRLDDALRRIRDGFDFRYGGTGTQLKVLDEAPATLFRALATLRGEAPLGRALVVTTGHMISAPIYDREEGGFHHYALSRDWSSPALEKRLESNARGLRILIEALLQDPSDLAARREAERTAAFITGTLLLPSGGLALAQASHITPDDTGHYFMATAEERRTRRPPPVVPIVVAGANARAGSALVRAGAALERPDLERAGLGVIDSLARGLYERGRGMSHMLSEQGTPLLPGLLPDQTASIDAFLTAYEVRGEQADLARAEDLFQFCLDNLRGAGGQFDDRVADPRAVGMLRRPLVSISENGRMALAGMKLAALTGSSVYREAADAALGALARSVPRLGGDDAPFGEALLARSLPVTRVVLLGPAEGEPEAARREALRRAALLLPVPGLAILRSEPADGRLEALGLRVPGAPGARGVFLCADAECVGPLDSASDLMPAFEAARAKRSSH